MKSVAFEPLPLKAYHSLVRQALDQIPPGPILADEPRVTLPPKAEVYNTIEGMIRLMNLSTFLTSVVPSQ